MIREFTWSEAWFLVEAVRWTVLLAVLAFIGGSVMGLIIAVLRIGKRPLPRAAAVTYSSGFLGLNLFHELVVAAHAIPVLVGKPVYFLHGRFVQQALGVSCKVRDALEAALALNPHQVVA